MRRTRHPRTVRTDVARAVIAQCLEDDRRWSLQELQLCIKSYEKICICLKLLQSGCHMHLLNNKNGVSMKLVVFLWEGIRRRTVLAEQHYRYWLNMGQVLWTWVKAPVSWMETWRIIAKTEISSEFISCKVNGNFGLWCPGSDFVSFCATWWNC